MSDTCPMQIMVRQLDDGVFRCKLAPGHKDDEHVATGFHDYQEIAWFSGDRREFAGEFEPCVYPKCRLPVGHRGGHAI